MSRKNKIKIFKMSLTIIVLILFLGITIYLFPVMKELSTIEGQIEFKNRVDSSGIIGLLSLFGLQVAQIFLIIVPGEPLEILAGMCYGALWGTIFIMISACIISTKILQNTKKIELILLILFFIPGTPKDLLVYVSGLLPIKTSKFIIISTFARFPSVISSTLAGASLANGNWKMSVILYAVIFTIATIVVLIINKFDKHKITQEAINSIK